MFSYLYTLLQENDCAVSCCSYQAVTTNDEPADDTEESLKIIGFVDAVKGLYDYSLWSVWGKLFKKELFTPDIPTYNLIVSEDLLLNYFLFKNAKRTVISNKKKYFYFRHKGSVMASGVSMRRIQSQIKAYKTVSEDLDKNSPAYPYQGANRVLNDFLLLNDVIKQNASKECFDTVLQDIKECKQYIFDKRNNYCVFLKHKIAFIILSVFPPLYRLMFKLIFS